LEDHRDRLPVQILPDLPLLIGASAWLRKEREFSFYGDIDFIPTERYSRDDAERAMSAAQSAVSAASAVIRPGRH
jgi:HEPN domain-containing protein